MSLSLPVASLAGAAATPNGFQQLLYQLLQQQIQIQQHKQQQQQQQEQQQQHVAQPMKMPPPSLKLVHHHVDFTSVQDMAKSDRPLSSRSSQLPEGGDNVREKRWSWEMFFFFVFFCCVHILCYLYLMWLALKNYCQPPSTCLNS